MKKVKIPKQNYNVINYHFSFFKSPEVLLTYKKLYMFNVNKFMSLKASIHS